jgi:putative endonuclease
MKPIGTHNYYVYITTNKNKTVLYIGVTNNLKLRLYQHEQNAQPFTHKSFAGKYNVYHLIYFERFEWIEHAIAREKELKGWRRSKKEDLINTLNPEWNFLNDTI